MEVRGGGKPGVMSEIDKYAQLRICELEDYVLDLLVENDSLRAALCRIYADQNPTGLPRSVPQSSLH